MARPITPSIHKNARADPISVDELAGDILTFLAAEPERLRRFLDITGLRVDTLRAAAAGPGFAASLLDYVVADERCLLAFSAASGHDPAAVATLHQRLVTPPTED